MNPLESTSRFRFPSRSEPLSSPENDPDHRRSETFRCDVSGETSDDNLKEEEPGGLSAFC
jgi:hypothetical protein